MSDQENLAELDENALFDDAVSDGPETIEREVEKVVPPEEPEVIARVDEPEKEIEPKAPDDSKIPEWRRAEIAESKRQAERDAATLREENAELKRRLAAGEKPAPAKVEEEPDPLLDPKGYREFIRAETQKEILNERREMSLQLAHKHYKEEFEEAYAAAQKGVDPALKAKMQASRDPGETLIAWHREQKTVREVGSDPNAWLEKKLEERMSDPAFLAKAVERSRALAANPTGQNNGRPRVELPPSLNGASRSNAALKSSLVDVSDDALFAETTQ